AAGRDQVAPDRAVVLPVIARGEQFINELAAFFWIGAVEERFGPVHGRYPARDIEVDTAKKLGVVGLGRSRHLGLGQAFVQLAIDGRRDRQDIACRHSKDDLGSFGLARFRGVLVAGFLVVILLGIARFVRLLVVVLLGLRRLVIGLVPFLCILR